MAGCSLQFHQIAAIQGFDGDVMGTARKQTGLFKPMEQMEEIAIWASSYCKLGYSTNTKLDPLGIPKKNMDKRSHMCSPQKWQCEQSNWHSAVMLQSFDAIPNMETFRLNSPKRYSPFMLMHVDSILLLLGWFSKLVAVSATYFCQFLRIALAFHISFPSRLRR